MLATAKTLNLGMKDKLNKHAFSAHVLPVKNKI